MCSSIVLTYRNVITGAVFVGNTLCSWFLMILTIPTPHDKAVEYKPYNASVLTSWYILFFVWAHLLWVKRMRRATFELGLISYMKKMFSGAQATQIPVRFVCVYVYTLIVLSIVSVAFWIIIFVRFCRGLDYYFRSFLSRFGLLFSFVSVAFWIIIFVRFCRCLDYYFRSFLSVFELLFSLVSVAVWTTVFVRFDRCLNFNRLQNTAALELNYFVFDTF